MTDASPETLPIQSVDVALYPTWAERVQQTRQLRGKYTQLLSSSTAFFAQKAIEKALEQQRDKFTGDAETRL